MPSLLMQAPLTGRPLESRPPPSVEECGPRLRCSTPCSLSQGRLSTVEKTPRPFPLVFHLFSKRLEHDGFRSRIERGLAAKQMPLSDPREMEETVYPETSSVPPIGFQGKSDAQLQASPTLQ